MNPKSFIVENNFIRVIKLSNSDERLIGRKKYMPTLHPLSFCHVLLRISAD